MSQVNQLVSAGLTFKLFASGEINTINANRATCLCGINESLLDNIEVLIQEVRKDSCSLIEKLPAEPQDPDSDLYADKEQNPGDGRIEPEGHYLPENNKIELDQPSSEGAKLTQQPEQPFLPDSTGSSFNQDQSSGAFWSNNNGYGYSRQPDVGPTAGTSFDGISSGLWVNPFGTHMPWPPMINTANNVGQNNGEVTQNNKPSNYPPKIPIQPIDKPYSEQISSFFDHNPLKPTIETTTNPTAITSIGDGSHNSNGHNSIVQYENSYGSYRPSSDGVISNSNQVHKPGEVANVEVERLPPSFSEISPQHGPYQARPTSRDPIPSGGTSDSTPDAGFWTTGSDLNQAHFINQFSSLANGYSSARPTSKDPTNGFSQTTSTYPGVGHWSTNTGSSPFQTFNQAQTFTAGNEQVQLVDNGRPSGFDYSSVNTLNELEQLQTGKQQNQYQNIRFPLPSNQNNHPTNLQIQPGDPLSEEHDPTQEVSLNQPPLSQTILTFQRPVSEADQYGNSGPFVSMQTSTLPPGTSYLQGLVPPPESHNEALMKLNQTFKVDPSDIEGALQSTVPEVVSNIFSNLNNLVEKEQNKPGSASTGTVGTLTSIDGSSVNVQGDTSSQIVSQGEKLFQDWIEHQLDSLHLTASVANYIRKNALNLFRRVLKQYVNQVTKLGGSIEENVRKATQTALSNTQTLTSFILRNYINFAGGLLRVIGEQVSRVGKNLDTTGNVISNLNLNPFDIMSNVLQSLPNPTDYADYFKNFGRYLMGQGPSPQRPTTNEVASQELAGSAEEERKRRGILSNAVGAIHKAFGSWFGG